MTRTLARQAILKRNDAQTEGIKGARDARFATLYAARAASTEWRPQSEVNVLLTVNANKERSNIDNLLADPAASDPGEVSASYM